jgi:hypothetical protein
MYRCDKCGQPVSMGCNGTACGDPTPVFYPATRYPPESREAGIQAQSEAVYLERYADEEKERDE